MRTIKFRGKDINTKKWIYGWLLGTVGGSFIGGVLKQNFHPVEAGCFEVVPETVGQFIGLFDRNGKNIYEGDVVQAEHDNFCDLEPGEAAPEYVPWTGVVLYKNGGYSIETDVGYSPSISNIRIKSIEVVGNIYNKERKNENHR